MPKVDLKTEALFLKEVQVGNLKVYKSGKVVNTATNHEYVPRQGKYKQITFRINDEKKTILVHRLVWIVFKGLITDPELQVNHKNGVKSENRLSNLELLTASANSQHAFDTGLSTPQKGSVHGRSKFLEPAVRKLRKTFSSGHFTLSEFAEKHEVSLSTMHSLLVGNTWSHVKTQYDDFCVAALKANRRARE